MLASKEPGVIGTLGKHRMSGEKVSEELTEEEDDSKEHGAYGLGDPHVTLASTKRGDAAR